jgi:hypothetical protein
MAKKNWDASVEVPTNSDYILRVLDVKAAPSNAGNPMITLVEEIAAPGEVVCTNGETVNIAGVKTTSYFTFKVMNEDGSVDEEKTANAQSRVFSNKENTALFQMYGIEVTPNQYDNPPIEKLIGKQQYARIKPDTKVKHDSPTAADLKAGKKEGKVSINPKTKKPIQTFYLKVEERYGLAEGSNSPAF